MGELFKINEIYTKLLITLISKHKLKGKSFREQRIFFIFSNPNSRYFLNYKFVKRGKLRLLINYDANIINIIKKTWNLQFDWFWFIIVCFNMTIDHIVKHLIRVKFWTLIFSYRSQNVNILVDSCLSGDPWTEIMDTVECIRPEIRKILMPSRYTKWTSNHPYHPRAQGMFHDTRPTIWLLTVSGPPLSPWPNWRDFRTDYK